MAANKRVSGGSSKFGRNKTKCDRYKAEHRRERNKLRIAKKLAKAHDKKAAKLAERAFREAESNAHLAPLKA